MLGHEDTHGGNGTLGDLENLVRSAYWKRLQLRGRSLEGEWTTYGLIGMILRAAFNATHARSFRTIRNCSHALVRKSDKTRRFGYGTGVSWWVAHHAGDARVTAMHSGVRIAHTLLGK